MIYERMCAMRTYIHLSSHGENYVRERMKKSTSVWEYRRLQCVFMRRHTMGAEDVAKIVGLHPGSVRNIWMRWKRGGADAVVGEKRGRVRARARWNREEEKAFLDPFVDAAKRGKLTTVQEIHLAQCKRVGKKLNPTVTWRLLHRHGWRKIVPRPQHPKADEEVRQIFKVFFPQDHHGGKDRSAPLWAPFPVDVQR